MFRSSIAVGCLVATASAWVGCAAPLEDGSTTEDDGTSHLGESQLAAVGSQNGLSAINGLSAMNGLSAINGLSAMNGLTSSGLVSGGKLMNTAEGRNTVSYLVRCALPAGHSIQKKDQAGKSYTFTGALGLAPGWENGATTQNERYWISSCMMAHINTTGQHIAIWLDGVAPVGWGRNASYPIQEGTFVGDLFASPPVARYCGGRGFGSNIVAGRIGDDNQVGEPYAAMHAANGSTRCDQICSRDPSGDGYLSCGMAGNAITVWRQMTRTPELSFESNTSGFVIGSGSPSTTLSLATDQHLHGSRSMLATIKASGSGTAEVHLFNPTGVKPGKNMTIFVKFPSNTNWSYVQAFAQDGAAKNYRWTSSGYNASEVLPGEWNSIVVPIPSDFATAGSKIGLSIHTTGSGTLKMYVDAISFDD